MNDAISMMEDMVSAVDTMKDIVGALVRTNMDLNEKIVLLEIRVGVLEWEKNNAK